MKNKNEITDIKLTKILKKKNKPDHKKVSKTLEELINEIPQKYHNKFWEEIGEKKPSRRDVDSFLRKYKLIKKQ